MYTLIVDCSGYGTIPSVYVADPTGAVVAAVSVSLDQLTEYAAKDGRIDNIKLSGIYDYCMAVKEDIEKELALEYAERKINVEVLK